MSIKRRLGQSDLLLSPLGIGTWQFSNKGGTWNTVTDKAVYEILKYSLTSGMNWIDTAQIYGNGISETLTGRALKQLETEQVLTDNIYIADKWFPLLRTAATITQTINQRLDCLQRPVIYRRRDEESRQAPWGILLPIRSNTISCTETPKRTA